MYAALNGKAGNVAYNGLASKVKYKNQIDVCAYLGINSICHAWGADFCAIRNIAPAIPIATTYTNNRIYFKINFISVRV